MSTQTPSSEALPTMPFRFMDLPPELRAQIYEELLAVSKIFYTPDWYDIAQGVRFESYEEYRKPSLSVLRVSKTIHREAEDVYLGKNLFVLPPMFNEMRPFWTDYDADVAIVPKRRSWLFSSTALLKIKHISIALCLRSSTIPSVMGHLEWGDNGFHSGSFDSMTPAERRDHTHDLVLDWNAECRSTKSFFICRLENLQSIEMDFTNDYCPMGCCRILDWNWDFMSKQIRRVCFLGLRNNEEKEMVLEDCSDQLGVSTDELKQMYKIEI